MNIAHQYHRPSLRRPLRLLAGLLCLALPALAATLPGDTTISDLTLTQDWIFELDEVAVEGAEIYHSDYEVAWLVRAPAMDALLISPRGNLVRRIADAESFQPAGASAAELAAGAAGERVAEMVTRGKAMTFELDGQRARLVPAPPLLGRQAMEAVEKRHPRFTAKRLAYSSAKSSALTPPSALKAGASAETTVWVYFGSWSSACRRIVPKIEAVEEAWRGHNVRFEYYGLPQPLTGDSRAVAQEIHGVPTVVVTRGGEEIGRITGRPLDDPATALSQVMGGN